MGARGSAPRTGRSTPSTEYAADRPAAWIDDNHGDASRLWALEREAPTLLVDTSCAVGVTDEHVDELLGWARSVAAATAAA